MTPHEQPWQRLVAAARRAEDAGPDAAPYGFATRVAALALSRPFPNPQALLEKFAWRGFFAAGVLGLAAAAYGYNSFATVADEELLTNDGVTELLGQT